MDTLYPHTNNKHNNRRLWGGSFPGKTGIARNIDKHLSAWFPSGKTRIPGR